MKSTCPKDKTVNDWNKLCVSLFLLPNWLYQKDLNYKDSALKVDPCGVPKQKFQLRKRTFQVSEFYSTGWNDKIVTLETTTWFHFCLMKTGFLFLSQTIYLLASCVLIPRARGAFYHVWKWHNVQRARSQMCRCTTHALYRSKVYLDVLKSVVIPWCNQVAGDRPWVWQQDSVLAHKSKETQAWLQKECYDFVPFSNWPPPPPTWTRWTTSFGHTSRTSPTWPPTTPKPAWSPPSAEYSLSSRWRLWKRHAPSFGSVLRLKAATLNRCQLYYIIKLPELIFFNKSFKIKLFFRWQFYRSTLYTSHQKLEYKLLPTKKTPWDNKIKVS